MRTSRFFLKVFVWTIFLLPIHSAAQTLSVEGHVPIITDSLMVYKLPYVAVSDTGRNCVWDFSNLSIDSADIIEVDYFVPSLTDTSLFGCHREHSNCYYHLAQDTLWLKGYETSRTYMRYTHPIPLLAYPVSYGDSLIGNFEGRGQYCHMTPLTVAGSVSARVDATGNLILPEDTFYNVLKVRTCMLYREMRRIQNYVNEERNSWYSPYCRYPLLETVQVQTIKRNDTVSFTSMYYYPQEHVDEPSHRQKQPGSLVEAMDSLITNISYLPNPVYNNVQIRYSLARQAQVYISMHHNGGATTYQTPLRSEAEGGHIVDINMNGMPIGLYVVYIHADDNIVSGNIIKL